MHTTRPVRFGWIVVVGSMAITCRNGGAYNQAYWGSRFTREISVRIGSDRWRWRDQDGDRFRAENSESDIGPLNDLGRRDDDVM